MLRSGIWEGSKNPKSCLRAKRRAGQLADAQTIPAHRLTTPLRLLRSSDRFLQRRMSLLPLPQKVYSSRALLLESIYSLTSCLKLLENSSYFESLSAGVEDISWSGTWKYPPLPQNTSSKYFLISEVSSQGVSELNR